MTKKIYKFIDLFAGIGGFHTAMHYVGARCVFASEWDKYARISYEENYKDSIIESLETLYLLDEHKDDYEISLSDDETKSIEDAAKEFSDANDSDTKDVVSGDEETVKKVLELLTIQQKMEKAMTADVDTNVSDDEAAQKKMQYVLFSTKTTDSDGNSTDMSDDEKAEVKKPDNNTTATAKNTEKKTEKKTSDSKKTKSKKTKENTADVAKTSEKETEKATEKASETELVTETESESEITETTEQTEKKDTMKDTKKEEVKKSSGVPKAAAVVVVIAVIGAIGAGLYFFVMKKPGR